MLIAIGSDHTSGSSNGVIIASRVTRSFLASDASRLRVHVFMLSKCNSKRLLGYLFLIRTSGTSDHSIDSYLHFVHLCMPHRLWLTITYRRGGFPLNPSRLHLVWKLRPGEALRKHTLHLVGKVDTIDGYPVDQNDDLSSAVTPMWPRNQLRIFVNPRRRIA